MSGSTDGCVWIRWLAQPTTNSALIVQAVLVIVSGNDRRMLVFACGHVRVSFAHQALGRPGEVPSNTLPDEAVVPSLSDVAYDDYSSS